MTIHAFTELHNNFPAFINLSEQPDGTIKVSVRTRGNDGKDYATITLTALQAEELADSIYKHNYKGEGEADRAAPPAAVQPDSGRDAALSQYGYQQLFDAIAEATKIEGGWISISVAAFRAALSTQPTENAAVQSLTDAALVETRALLEREQRDAQALASLLRKERARFEFLHSTNRDADGWEWGVARVRVAADGRIEYLWGNSDHSDIDAAILAAASAKGGA